MPMLETLLDLIDATGSIDNGLPEVRAGVAAGPALERAGDWYGATVNLASRITGVGDPNSVVAVDAVRLAAPDGYRWEYIAEPPLKGIPNTPPLHRVSRA
jgi:adenylate cyclase